MKTNKRTNQTKWCIVLRIYLNCGCCSAPFCLEKHSKDSWKTKESGSFKRINIKTKLTNDFELMLLQALKTKC